MKISNAMLFSGAILLTSSVVAATQMSQVSDQFIVKQRQLLITNATGKGFGPQSPRNIDSKNGNNNQFSHAPAYKSMNLCNIHFHKNAEHQGGEFTKYAGNGDGDGYQGGYQYSKPLTKAELTSLGKGVCSSAHSSLVSGDTIEVHYVYSTAKVQPGPTLGSCLNDSINNPQLRVEAQVYVLVNDKTAKNFGELTEIGKNNGLHQALKIPTYTGTAVQYSGSTTGPKYNEVGSPFQVTWSVRPEVAKVNIETVGNWCKGNIFKEDHAHGVRNLVINPELLSTITP